MRAVLDTNILLSGLLWRGAPHSLLAFVRNGTLTLVTSPALLAEFGDVIQRPKFQAILTKIATNPLQLLADLRRITDIVDAPSLPIPVCRDPDDDQVLAVALAGAVDWIVSGDDDLLILGAFQGIPIIDAASAVARMDGRGLFGG